MKKAFTLAEGAMHVAKLENMQKFAFTLAEVLITLGIIGVVAAMTLLVLIQNHQKQVYVTGAKKAVNVISNMLQKEMADEGVSSMLDTELIQSGCKSLFVPDSKVSYSTPGMCSDEYGINSGVNIADGYGGTNTLEEIIPRYIKVTKVCTGYNCTSDIKYEGLAGGAQTFNCNASGKNCTLDLSGKNELGLGYIGPLYVVYSTDGAIYYFARGTMGLFVGFDTNGKKGPNQYGRDLHCMMVVNNKIVGSDCEGLRIGNTVSTLGHLMSNGWNMDY